MDERKFENGEVITSQEAEKGADNNYPDPVEVNGHGN